MHAVQEEKSFIAGEPLCDPCTRIPRALVHAVQEEKSFIAGERAGLLRAFRETLPAQRTLGELASGLNRMQIQMDNDRLHARQAATTVAELSAKLQVFPLAPFISRNRFIGCLMGHKLRVHNELNHCLGGKCFLMKLLTLESC